MTDTVEARWENHNEAGRKLFAQGDYVRAEQAFIAAIREATSLGADNTRLAASLSNLGQLKYRQKDLSQAQALFRRSLAIRERLSGAEDVSLTQNLNNLAAIHFSRGELDQAEPLFRRSLAISEKHLGEKHPDVSLALNNLARLYFRRNDQDAAAPLLLRLLSIKQDLLGAEHPEVAAILTSLAKVRSAQGEHDAAEQLARRALAIREKLDQPNDPAVATSLEALAEICGRRGKHDEEQELRQRALAIREQTLGADHPAVAAVRATMDVKRATAEVSAGFAAPRRSGAASPPPPAAPHSPAPTTKSVSLPWIEPPTSPALRRPLPTPPQPFVQPAAVHAAPSSAGSAALAPSGADLTRFGPPVHAAAPAVAQATSHAGALADAAMGSLSIDGGDLPTDAANGASETGELDVESVDWQYRRRRPWLKIVAAATMLSAVAGGAWTLLGHSSTSSAEPGAVAAATAGQTLAGPVPASAVHAGASPAASADSVARREGQTSNTVQAAVPPAVTEAAPKPASSAPSSPPPSSIAQQEHQGPRAEHAASESRTAAAPAATTSEGADSAKALPLPKINVDRITTAISEKARARTDSLGRVVTVKPPTFDKPNP